LSVLTTNQKGAIAEARIAAAAIEAGADVYRPVVEGGRYDLIFGIGGRLLRIQCKWATRYGGVVVVRCYSARRARAGLERKLYTAAEIDAFAVYCGETESCYYLPVDLVAGRAQLHLRLSPARNRQQLGTHDARRYELGATLAGLNGPIAQLGERRHGMAKVVGSSPTGSMERPS
jgi:PD-(D/E)XK nuclease superfamily protein